MEKFFGMLNASCSTVYNELLQPAISLVLGCVSYRSCPELSDSDWVSLGIERALHESATGRAFLQTHGARLDYCPDYSHYFHTLKSSRRLQLLSELNLSLMSSLKKFLPDELAVFPQLVDFDVYAGDGHWHRAACHDPIIDQKTFATGHFYALDLRFEILSLLTTATGKKEHDMHALKRLTKTTLRQGAPAGRKVIYVWDKASIDFRFWRELKNSSGIYFISLEKEKMALDVMGLKPWDKKDPINCGILNDQLVGSSNGIMLRRVTCQAPDTGQIRVFLTSEMTLPPGLIAHLYHRRWRIEKVFDCLKNKLNEKKSWATSEAAKSAQAQFLCLTHNFIERMEHLLATQEAVVNQPEIQRHQERLAEQKILTENAARSWPSTWETLLKPVQYSVKLVRWLRSSILARLAWTAALPRLKALYAVL